MIRRIQLVSFGKFRNFRLECAPVTIIEGANESGKTTIFDALLDTLCNPKGTTEAGKLLKTRYGDDRVASLEFDGKQLELSPVDFLNLFAIRAGDLSVEVSKDSEWLSQVKAQLFSGGIDPLSVAERLIRQCESRARGTLNAEVEDLRAGVARLERELDELRRERETALGEERESIRSEGELEKIRSELEALRKEEERVAKALEQQKLHRTRQELLRIRETIESARMLRQELEETPSYGEEEWNTLRRMEQKLLDLDSRIQKVRILEEEAGKELQKLQAEAETQEAESRRLQQVRDFGVSLRTRLEDRSTFMDRRVTYTVRPVLLALAAGVLLLGLGGMWFFPRDLSILPLAVGILGSVLLGFLGVRRETREDDTRFRNAVERICAEWEREGGDPTPEKTWEGFLAALVRTEERLRNTRNRLESLHASIVEGRRRIETLEAELQGYKHERDETGYDLKTMCDRLKVQDSAHYASQMEKRQEKETRLRELNRLIGEAAKRYGQSTGEGLRAFIGAELDRIERHLTEAEQPETELLRLENLLRQKREERERLEGEEKRLLQVVHRKKGEVSGAYRDLPERIVRTGQELARIRASLGEKERSLLGARRAAEMFRSLAADNDTLLSALSEEITGMFSRIAPIRKVGKTEGSSRKVSLKTFSLKDTEVMDAEGFLRPLGVKEKREAKEGGGLSTGTRDAFLLAARLTLARKAVREGKEGLLVMDEPFLTLDTERVDRALDVLQEFQRSTGWQIFLFTKEEDLARKVETRFPRLARRIELD
ncbi:MAG: AAA family ATPase [Spirochaetales bacterium]